MQKSRSLDKFPSTDTASSSATSVNRVHSLSLSQIKQRYSELANYQHKPSPFSIRWINGFNFKAGVINLNDRGSTTVLYAACNMGVLYNWTTNQMRILQGHKHMVTSISADGQGKWLVTADTGPENIIIIWDSNDYFPYKTIFSPHVSMRVVKVALSADAKYLLSLGYQQKAVLHFWIWSYEHEGAHAILGVDVPRDSILSMCFNPANSEQFILMTKHDIWIGISAKIVITERGIQKITDNYELKIRKPEKNTSPEFGRLTSFTFVRETSQVLVATSKGAVLVYGYTIQYKENVDPPSYENLRFIKALKIEKNRINVIKYIDGTIVTGNSVGEIRFYDLQLKLLYWVHGFKVDNVKNISFNISPRSYQIFDPKCGKPCLCWENVEVDVDSLTGYTRQKLIKKRLPSDATTASKPFLVRDFIVCSNNQGVGFVDFVTEKLITIMDFKIAPALTLTVHPEKTFLSVGYTDGVVDLLNFVQHKLFKRLDLRDHYKIVIPPSEDSIKCNYEISIPQISVTCLKYSPSGLHLACGMNTGELIFLDPVTIDIITETPHKDTSYAIKEINYSCDSLTMACADVGRTVCVYKYNCEKYIWWFVGKHRAHYKDITAIFFTPLKNENGDYKLLSLGADRVMVEYDIGSSSDEYLEIFSLDRVDQSGSPLTGIVWPTPKYVNPETCRTDLPMILVANDEHKYKIVNYSTTMTLSTVLGPRFETPVCKVLLINKKEDTEELQYLLFATRNVIGLQKLPLDGNPWKHVGMLGHPIQLTELCFREDSGTLFTIGAKDTCVCQWNANYRSVESTAKLGGGELDPYYCIIEDGRPGWLFQEVRDLFYYIQILCQGTFSPAMRRVKDYIPVDSLPDMMRALGYFPSEYEVENLITEGKFKIYQCQPSPEIDFEEFVKLYLNHRPAFGDNFMKIRNSFKNFATFSKETYEMVREDFIEMLGSYGECFSQELSWYLLSILSGHSFEDRATMQENDFEFLPEKITFTDFVTNILGLQDVDNLSEQHSIMDSIGSSQHTGSSLTSQSEDK